MVKRHTFIDNLFLSVGSLSWLVIWISRDNWAARDQQAQGSAPTESTGYDAGPDGQSGGAYHFDPRTHSCSVKYEGAVLHHDGSGELEQADDLAQLRYRP